MFERSILNKISLKYLRPSFRRYASSYSSPLRQARLTPTSAIVLLGITGVGLYSLDARSAINEYVWCPLIRWCTTAEQGHRLGIDMLKYGLSPRAFGDHDDPILEVEVFDRTLANPITMAAGFDKQGEAMDPLFDLGFGGVEIGTMTPEPQFGNPRPRFFRLPADDAVINRYGINSDGHMKILSRLRVRFEKYMNKGSSCKTNNSFRDGKMLLINIGKNRDGDEVNDYIVGVDRFAPYADVLVLNVSCPSAPGMRDLQAGPVLTNLLTKVREERDKKAQGELVDPTKKPPILVKVAPDLGEKQIADIAEAAKKSQIDGIIMSNTTIQRPETLITKGDVVSEKGGLSGAPLKEISLKAFRILRKYTKDSNLVLVGCGGIFTGQDAIEFAKAGATFVELYSAFAYKGPGLADKVKDEIVQELKKEGKTWMEIVGSDDNE
ncbi:DEKNAAC102978 [Brettanomyces naardenensis]|uniref:Dihydroorotate dehydrogenase (quinone), mitochondrial n=1 Tax=Brettanomyces naardenensis TaxID=13370 RepID=A0A448YM74_BRENA|nr:DEKNAAC102978 [Brettanomyces naardenensis]